MVRSSAWSRSLVPSPRPCAIGRIAINSIQTRSATGSSEGSRERTFEAGVDRRANQTLGPACNTSVMVGRRRVFSAFHPTSSCTISRSPSADPASSMTQTSAWSLATTTPHQRVAVTGDSQRRSPGNASAQIDVSAGMSAALAARIIVESLILQSRRNNFRVGGRVLFASTFHLQEFVLVQGLIRTFESALLIVLVVRDASSDERARGREACGRKSARNPCFAPIRVDRHGAPPIGACGPPPARRHAHAHDHEAGDGHDMLVSHAQTRRFYHRGWGDGTSLSSIRSDKNSSCRARSPCLGLHGCPY